MPIFRIVYIDDDTFAPRTLTAAFANRAAAEIAMAMHGNRVVHMSELGPGERATDPVRIAMAGGAGAAAAREVPVRSPPRRLLGRLRAGLAGGATVVGIVAIGAVLLMF